MKGQLLAVGAIAGLTASCAGRAVNVGSSAQPVTARATAVDYPSIERGILADLNAARTNPTAYAANISAIIPYYNGVLLQRPGSAIAVRTNEGASAAREAVGALRSQSPVPPLTLDANLSRAARDLVVDQGRTGDLGHTGSDGSTPASRISRYGTWSVSTQENVDYGQAHSGRDVVEALLIDDGVPDRGHRRNIFDATARVVGIACGPHPRYGVVCVIDQAGRFTSR